MSDAAQAEADQQPSSWCGRIQQWIAHEWAPVCFVVSFVIVLHHLGPFMPVSRLTLLVLATMHSKLDGRVRDSPKGPDATVWVVSIDSDDFEDRYRERRPFDRCKLQYDLKTLLLAGPSILAIDIDLSPIAKATPEEAACQQGIDDLPGQYRDTKFVLIDPRAAASARWAEAKTEWKRTFLRYANVRFSQAEIAFPLNVAIEYQCTEAGLAEIVYEQWKGRAPQACQHGSHESHALSYFDYRQRVHERRASQRDDPPPKGAVVFFGSRAGSFDTAVTPIGEVHGVVVHAAKLVSFDGRLRSSAGLNLFFDLLFASLYSAVIAVFLWFFLRLPVQDSPIARARRTCWMLAFAVIYLVLLGLLAALSWTAIAGWGLVTEPALIAMGLAIDGFVVSGWSHVGTTAHADHPRCLKAREVLHAIAHSISRSVKDLVLVCRTAPWYGAASCFRLAVFWGFLLTAIIDTVG